MAATPVITVEHLSKRYVIGRARQQSETLRDTLAHGARGLFARLLRQRDAARIDREDFWALRDLSFTINQGDVVGIIGRNGAGKSTLLKVLSRITEPTQGRIRIQGRVASLLEVGTGFHPELSGRENIFLNGAILGMRRAEIRRKFDEIVAFAEVEKFLDTPVKHYSSGMYVRLAFAVAAHLEPEILIVDEVLAVGDAQFQRKCIGKMKDVARGDGRTVLLVSHNLGTVTSLCSQTIWLEQGRVRSVGTPEETTAAYLRQFSPENSLSFPLADVRRDPNHTGRLIIQRVELNGGDPLVNRAPLSARIHFVTSSPVTDVSFGLGFATVDGTRLLTMDSDFNLERRDLPAGCTGSVELRLPSLDLGPGTYCLDVGARSGDVTGLDYLPAFGVTEVHTRPGVPAGFVILGGGVRTEASWHWNLS
jgi:lipopolysaccharide transport system ATP-binding protein